MNNADYYALRNEFTKAADTAPSMPAFIRACPDVPSLWSYLKGFSPQWAPRRQHVREALAPLLDHLASGAVHPGPPAKPLTPWDLPIAPRQPAVPLVHPTPTATVFLVHGRDDGAKHEVARYLERLGLRVTILHEQANGGRTLLSKFTEEAAKADFALVLMTADDLGGLKHSSNPIPRARQNVVFELGFFIGKLGPSKVCALVEAGIERPSDFEAVVYVAYGPATSWKMDVARELRDAGVNFDHSKVF